MNAIHVILASAIFAISPALAQTEPALPAYSLKNRSSFTFSVDSRVPFWPIGWQRPKEGQPIQPVPTQKVAAAPKVKLTSEPFFVSSILLGKPSLATINGRSFEEGEFLPVKLEEQRLNVQIRAIREQGVWLQLDNQPPILVPLRRDEIRPRNIVTPGQTDWTIQIKPPEENGAPKPIKKLPTLPE
jgi:hypothetical protein